jgi:hypothetical protein
VVPREINALPSEGHGEEQVMHGALKARAALGEDLERGKLGADLVEEGGR